MKTKPFGFSLLLAAGLLAARAAQCGDFSYEADGAGVTISEYTGSGGAVTIPDAIQGRPVTRIGDSAFYDCTGLTSVVIPDSVVTLEGSLWWDYGVFSGCSGLTNVVLGRGITHIGDYAFYKCTGLTKVTIPDSVTSIGYKTFQGCIGLTNITIGNSVTHIGSYAFSDCAGLTSVYFAGEPPELGWGAFSGTRARLYHLPGTTGWPSTYGGRPTAVSVRPDPVILDFGPHFGVQTNGFGFRIAWATNANVVVEACTDLAHPAWSAVSTHALKDGWVDFRDPDWAMHPVRFYRVRAE